MIGMNCLHSATDTGKSISKIPTPVSAAWTYTSESMRRASSFMLSALRNRSSGGETGIDLRARVATNAGRVFRCRVAALRKDALGEVAQGRAAGGDAAHGERAE